ncbi:MAG: DUF882 domain-containing protein [Myxococcales bacterium]
MEAPQDGLTVILLTHPGAPARQLRVPRAWPAFLGVFGMLSVCGSLLIGRQARALCEAEGALGPEPALMMAGLDQEEPLLVSSLGGVGSKPAASMGTLASARTLAALSVAPGLSSVAGLTPTPSQAPSLPASARPLVSGKALPLFDINGGRALTVTPFDQDGVANPEAFAQIRTFMRCRRSGHEMDMDPRLIALLSRISQHFGDARLQIISGHRKPDGKATRETSQHAFGTAADIRIAGVAIDDIKRAAHELGAKGVGLYTKGQFVHVDVRERAYSWRDTGEELDESEGAETLSQKGSGEAVADAPVVAAAGL